MRKAIFAMLLLAVGTANAAIWDYYVNGNQWINNVTGYCGALGSSTAECWGERLSDYLGELEAELIFLYAEAEDCVQMHGPENCEHIIEEIEWAEEQGTIAYNYVYG